MNFFLIPFNLCPIKHRWTIWEDRVRGTVMNSVTRQRVGYFIQQDRRCKICKKVDLRILKAIF